MIIIRNKLNRTQKMRSIIALVMLVLICAVIILLSCCQSDKNPIPEENFEAEAFFRMNTVEIIATGAFGETQSGTGIILSGSDYPIIATNFHVAGKYGGLISVRFFGESDFVNTNTIVNDNIIKVLCYDEYLDLCIFRVDYKPLNMYNILVESILETQIIPFFEHTNVEPLTKIASLGNASGGGIKKFDGEIVALERIVSTKYGYLPLIQTTLAIQQGCSGGPFFDEKGRLLGITSFAGGPWGDEYSFSLPIEFVYRLYQDTIGSKASGQIKKLNTEFSIIGEELNPDEINIYFSDLDIKLGLRGIDITIVESTRYMMFLGYNVVGFGCLDAFLGCRELVSESLKYSLEGDGEALKITVEKDGTSSTLNFTEYRLKN